MGRRSHTQRLIIWLNGTPVGCWEISAGKATLTYFLDWLNDENTRPLSLSLPFTPNNEPHRGLVVQNYFDNLLPDSDTIRRRIASHFNTGGTEPHQLLAAIGRDCVGAIQLLPEDTQPTDLFKIQGQVLSEKKIAEILRNTTSDQPLGQRTDEEDLRLSIAGAQEKSALLLHENVWKRPIGSTPTTHIFKLPLGLVGAMQADMRTSVENEWLCSRIMQAFDLPIANCEIAHFEDVKTLIVERFDRRYSDDSSWIVRLPQEDFCQVKGISPLKKYQSDGGPGITEIMNILLGSSNADIDRYNFFKTQIIFWLLAATDGHAKNFSIFLQPESKFQATPLYDVLSAHPIIGTTANKMALQRVKLAMSVRGSTNYYNIQQIQRRHWLNHARSTGLAETTAESIIEEILFKSEKVVASVAEQIPAGFPHDVADSIFSGLLEQCRRLKSMA
jgi:serine/threonine-protein kinase HipA